METPHYSDILERDMQAHLVWALLQIQKYSWAISLRELHHHHLLLLHLWLPSLQQRLLPLRLLMRFQPLQPEFIQKFWCLKLKLMLDIPSMIFSPSQDKKDKRFWTVIDHQTFADMYFFTFIIYLYIYNIFLLNLTNSIIFQVGIDDRFTRRVST